MKRLMAQRETSIIIAVLVLVILGGIKNPAVFLSSGNILGILLNVANDAIIAVAMTILMVCGGFDMSVGSIFGFSSMLAAIFMVKLSVPIVPAIIIVLLIIMLLGAANGFIVAKIGINAFITTLATMNMIRGLIYIVSNGENLGGFPKSFLTIGQTSIGGIQLPIIYMIVFIVLGDILLRKSRYLRQMYFIGGNEKSALLSGINVPRMKILCFVLCALFAGVAGIIWAARTGTASVNTGLGTEIRVITAVIIGGASLNGGEGSVLGSFFGAILMVMIISIMSLYAINVYWQNFVTGAVLLIAVLLEVFTQKNRQKKAIAASNIVS